MPVRSKVFLDPTTTKFGLKDLQTKFPEGVKPDKKEAYLAKEEFEKIFQMTIEEFYALKLWRQKELKKMNKLF